MQQLARDVGDSLYIGIGKVYEALVMDMAATVWGDVPYRQAADSTNLTPAFDPAAPGVTPICRRSSTRPSTSTFPRPASATPARRRTTRS